MQPEQSQNLRQFPAFTSFSQIQQKQILQKNLKSRSLKTNKFDEMLQRSFQSSILTENIQVYENLILTYFRSILKQDSNDKSLAQIIKSIFIQSQKKQDVQQSCPLNNNRILSIQQIVQFKIDLQYEKELSGFLSKIIDKDFLFQLSEQIVFLTQKCYSYYLDKKNLLGKQQQYLIKLSSDFAKYFKQKQLYYSFHFLNVERGFLLPEISQDEKKDKFFKFVKYFCATLFHVFQGFFDNILYNKQNYQTVYQQCQNLPLLNPIHFMAQNNNNNHLLYPSTKQL